MPWSIIRSLRAGLVLAAAAAITAPPGPAAAKVIRFEVVRVESPALGGRSFGATGTYDKIVARATIGVAPTDAHDVGIADIDLAPRDPAGLVEAVGEVEILRPTDPAKANHHLFYEVLNRGRKLSLVLLNDAPDGSVLTTPEAAGNGFLMEQGYTFVWSGWQGDTLAGDGRLTLSVPIVPGVTGTSREEWVFDNTTNPASAALTYPAADLAVNHARLTVREREADPRATPADLSFSYDGPGRITITRPAGFDAGAIYELIYPAKDPKVMGMGFAATRDVVSYLRYETADGAGNPNPLADIGLSRAIGLGISQSGRFLRDFLYLGFDEDEAGRIVFEGVMPHIAGGKRTFVNQRWAQPGRHSQQHEETTFPGDQFPFSYPVLADPVSGRTDGILAHCLASERCPKVMQSDSGTEFYQSRAALVVTGPAGQPIELPETVRAYSLADHQHFPSANSRPQPSEVCQQMTNPLHAGPIMRALLTAMDGWITSGTLPPATRYPSLANGTLVAPETAASAFPAIPGFKPAGLVNRPTLVDHSVMPPVKGTPYPVFVPKIDADGHDVAGIRVPAIEAPVATQLGWNLRKPGFAEGELCDLIGSTMPFPANAAERAASGDGRRSIAERYPNQGDYAAAFAASADHLVADRLMLPADASRLAAIAAQGPLQKASR
jgi:hypothetical protein